MVLQLVDKVGQKSDKVFVEIDKVHTKVFIPLFLKGFMATVTVEDNKKTIKVVELEGVVLAKRLAKIERKRNQEINLEVASGNGSEKEKKV